MSMLLICISDTEMVYGLEVLLLVLTCYLFIKINCRDIVTLDFVLVNAS